MGMYLRARLGLVCERTTERERERRFRAWSILLGRGASDSSLHSRARIAMVSASSKMAASSSSESVETNAAGFPPAPRAKQSHTEARGRVWGEKEREKNSRREHPRARRWARACRRRGPSRARVSISTRATRPRTRRTPRLYRKKVWRARALSRDAQKYLDESGRWRVCYESPISTLLPIVHEVSTEPAPIETCPQLTGIDLSFSFSPSVNYGYVSRYPDSGTISRVPTYSSRSTAGSPEHSPS